MARKKRSNYRKIYEQHYGPISKDADGRSLEVHHLDGDHENNSIENLVLVTIDEHYSIHKAQGDYVACFLMAQRMALSPEELSDLASKSATMTNARRIAEGTHNFCDSEAARERNNKRVEAGSHNLLKRADGGSQAADMVASGRHHFVKNNPVNKLLESGNHASKIKLSCRFCKKTTSKNQFNKFHSNCE